MVIHSRIAITASAIVFCISKTSWSADLESCKAVRYSDVGWTDISATLVGLEVLGCAPEAIVLTVPVNIYQFEEQWH